MGRSCRPRASATAPAPKGVSDDRGLIRYLLRHRHTTPFEMCELKLTYGSPWTPGASGSATHRSVNETAPATARPSTPPNAPRPTGGAAGATTSGSQGWADPDLGGAYRPRRPGSAPCPDRVRGRLQAGIAREQARKDLPLCTYTEAYWKIDLHNLLHFLPCAWTGTPSWRP